MRVFAEAFQSLADPTRLRIVRLLADGGKDLCVCELVDALEVAPHNVSRHLAVLRRAGLLMERKEGRWVYYGLSSKPSAFLQHLLSAAREVSDASLAKDKRELAKRFKIREGGKCLKGIQKALLSPR